MKALMLNGVAKHPSVPKIGFISFAVSSNTVFNGIFSHKFLKARINTLEGLFVLTSKFHFYIV